MKPKTNAKKAFKAELKLWRSIIDHAWDELHSHAGGCRYFKHCLDCVFCTRLDEGCGIKKYYIYTDYVDIVNPDVGLSQFVFDKVSHAFAIAIHNDVIDLYIDYLKNGPRRTPKNEKSL